MNIETKPRKIFNVINIIFLTLLAIVTFYPFWYVLVASLNEGRDFVSGGVYFWPRVFTLENYSMAFEDKRIFHSLGISIARTLIGTSLSIVLTSLLAYAISVKTLPGRSFFALFFYFSTIFSGGMIPYYMLLRDLGLTDSFWLYIIPSLYSFFNFLILRTSFDNIPTEMRESAYIDGAGDLTILLKIYLPLAVPTIATISLFIGVGHWNDWFVGSYYQSDSDLIPASTLLRILLSEVSGATANVGQESSTTALRSYTPQSIQMAFVMILTMPIVVVYPFLQKYYVKGVMIGSVKG
ncbi:MAG: carbohydrate ABC transporter permease [Lachnospirales bacterium]